MPIEQCARGGNRYVQRGLQLLGSAITCSMPRRVRRLGARRAQVRVAVCGQSKRTAEAEGRENLDWEETLVRARALVCGGVCCSVYARAWHGCARMWKVAGWLAEANNREPSCSV